MKPWGWMLPVLALVSCRDSAPDAAAEPKKDETPLEKMEKLLGTAEEEAEAGDEPSENAVKVRPEAPVAVAVPGQPGFVFSPYNGRKIDVNGVPPGTLVADPWYPAEEKKYFVVPKPPDEKPVPQGKANGTPEADPEV